MCIRPIGAWVRRRPSKNVPMPTASTRRRFAITAFSLLIVLSACSSTGSNGRAASGTTSPSGTTTPTSSTTPAGSAGCGHPADAPVLTDKIPGDVAETISVAGTTRDYRLGVPDDYSRDRPTPLIVNLHGSGSNAIQASVYSDLPRQAGRRGMITVAPDAIAGKWQLGATGTDHDFLMALVKNIESRYCIDRDRVFLIGMSLGAWKAAITACTEPDTFAAAVLVAVEVHPPNCPPVPVLAFHGTADQVVPYGAGSGHSFPNSPNAGLPGTHENIASWAKGNSCDPKPEVKKIGADVERWTYRNCSADLVLYTIVGGGHTWPGATVKIGPTTQTIDATRLALDWFQAHPRTG